MTPPRSGSAPEPEGSSSDDLNYPSGAAETEQRRSVYPFVVPGIGDYGDWFFDFLTDGSVMKRNDQSDPGLDSEYDEQREQDEQDECDECDEYDEQDEYEEYEEIPDNRIMQRYPNPVPRSVPAAILWPFGAVAIGVVIGGIVKAFPADFVMAVVLIYGGAILALRNHYFPGAGGRSGRDDGSDQRDPRERGPRHRRDDRRGRGDRR